MTHDPLVVANFYLKAITNLGGAQNTMRMDLGQKTFIVRNFKYFSLKTVTAFCTLNHPGTSEWKHFSFGLKNLVFLGG